MIKQAIITLNYVKNNDELYTLLRQVCVTSIRDYARRMNVDFILMNNNNDGYDGTFNQFQCLDYLDYYDKIMYIDGDCYIPKFFNTNILTKIDINSIGISPKNRNDWYYIEKIDCWSIYAFIIFCVHRNMRHYYLSCKEDRENRYEEIFLNIAIQRNQLESCIYDLSYIQDSKFFPKQIKTNKIYHFRCNDKDVKLYRDLLIKNLKQLKIKSRSCQR